MKFSFWSVGKAHEEYVKQGIADFSKRISNYYKVDWNIIPVPRNAASLSEAELKKKEAGSVLGQLKKEDYLVLLDERGRQMSSEGLAGFIEARANGGTRSIVFLVGGAFGVDESVSRRADLQWSLSLLVFPHQLVRLILAEQVYRACTILRNERYHHK